MVNRMARRWFAVLRTSLFVMLFMATVGVYLPLYLGLLSKNVHLHDWRVIGVLPLAIGAYIAVRCAYAFAWTGEGTPAPFDAPRNLVVTGWYRYLRNPMYFGMALFLAGEFFLFGTRLIYGLYYIAFFAISVSIFVLFYEEPTLRRKFPNDYSEYFRNVPRFFPRVRPWKPENKKGAASA